MHWSRSRRWSSLAIVAMLVVLTACDDGSDGADASEEPSEMTLVVDVRVSGSENVTGDLANCSGSGKFVDVFRGARAFVTDENAEPLVDGRVTTGLTTNYYQDILDECSFRIRVPAVPRAKGYFLVIGRQYPRAFSRQMLTSRDGRLKFDLNTPNVRGAPY